MKPLMICTAITFLSITNLNFGLTELVRAFKSGNTTTVSAYLDKNVEITMNGQNKNYNKVQATNVLADFFSTNKVSDFKVLHQSESAESAYCIGNLITSNGSYRLTFYAKDKNGRTLIQEIRIEK